MIQLDTSDLRRLAEKFKATGKMPIAFIGHGSPMNAIEDNVFVRGIQSIGRELPLPNAILCISAHWETYGTKLTAMESPRTIHDFGGFPPALYEVEYPVKGDPLLAADIEQKLNQHTIHLDHHWGLDHGAWTVAKHLYPNADVPIIQMSLDRYLTPQRHFELAADLSFLRRRGVLILGSGNMVHNLGKVAWDRLYGEPFAFDWAEEADSKMKDWIINRSFQELVRFDKQGDAFKLAIPTAEHYLPLLYTLALVEDADEHLIFNDLPVAGSLTMTSVLYA